MNDDLTLDEAIHAALERAELVPLPDILRGYPLEIRAYLASQMFPAVDPESDEVAQLIDTLLTHYPILDVSDACPWHMGPLRCAWRCQAPGVLQGWRRLRLPGIEERAKAEDGYAPHLHVSPLGYVFYQPGPLCLDPQAPELIAVESIEQLIHLLERV